MDKEHAVHIYSGICNLKEGNNAIYKNMNGPRDYHTKKKSQTEEDKYHMVSLKSRILKKKMIQMNLFTK